MIMIEFSREDYQRIISYIVVATLFVLVSNGIRGHEDIIRLLLHNGSVLGVAVFILFTALFVVFIIPLDIVLLIPIGVSMWGSLLTAFMSIAGWTLGAGVAFLLSRHYGLPLVSRMVGEKRVTEFHDRIPKSNLFWSVVILRMLVPVDLLSYALGLFSRLSWSAYILATLIGVAPFGFFFAYAGILPLWYQFGAITIALSATSLLLMWYWKGH